MLKNSDSESSTELTAEAIQALAKRIREVSIPLHEWAENTNRILRQTYRIYKRSMLYNSKQRIWAVYWAKGHKHRLTRKELTKRGLTRRAM